jgi:dCTP diphosphatase
MMNEKTTTLYELRQKVARFMEERDWNQFHNPKNLSVSLSCEAAELMELFVWTPEASSRQTFEEKRTEAEHEVADILFNLLEFCNHTNIDLAAVFERKFKLIEQKYPVEKAKGKTNKYTEL